MLALLADALRRFTDRQDGPSPYLTPIGSVVVLRANAPNPPMHRISQPAMCIVAQGAKWANFGGTRLEYKGGEALVIGVETPSVGRVVQASPDQPCLVLAFELDLGIMRSVMADLTEPPKVGNESGPAIFVTNFLGPIADCALRLVRLLDTPDAIPVLYPLIMREMCYWLLSGPDGSNIARLAMNNAPSKGVLNAISWLREHLAEPSRVEDVAAVAQMSPSSFHRHFKALTSLSPLQYQKQLRLLEARRLMMSCGANVETAAFEVGYQSASQFSREYARMFGEAPKRDVTQKASNVTDIPHDTDMRPVPVGIDA